MIPTPWTRLLMNSPTQQHPTQSGVSSTLESEHLVQLLSTHLLPTIGRNTSTNFEILSAFRKRGSDLLRVALKTNTHTRILWVKIPRFAFPVDKAHDIQCLTTEFDTLEMLYDYFSNSPYFGVVKPLAMIREIPAIVTEESQGLTLSTLLAKFGRIPNGLWSTPTLELLYRRCGEWLKSFHETTHTNIGATDWNPTIHYCDLRLKHLVDRPESGVDLVFARQIRARLIQYVNSIDERNDMTAGRHNDFAGNNIIVTPDRKIILCDLTLFDYGPTAFDCYNFIHHIEMLATDMRYPWWLRNRLISEFTKGYGKNFPKDPTLRNIVFCRINITKLLTKVCDTPPKNPLKRHYSKKVRHSYLKWLHAFAEGNIC